MRGQEFLNIAGLQYSLVSFQSIRSMTNLGYVVQIDLLFILEFPLREISLKDLWYLGLDHHCPIVFPSPPNPYAPSKNVCPAAKHFYTNICNHPLPKPVGIDPEKLLWPRSRTWISVRIHNS